MSLAIKKDLDKEPELIVLIENNFYRFKNGCLFLFCSWIIQREIGIAEGDVCIVLCDHSSISSSDIFVLQSSQIKNLSLKTSPH